MDRSSQRKDVQFRSLTREPVLFRSVFCSIVTRMVLALTVNQVWRNPLLVRAQPMEQSTFNNLWFHSLMVKH
jgi:hypothetical protein